MAPDTIRNTRRGDDAFLGGSRELHASDILSHQRVDDLIVEPINIRDSYAHVSIRPGLGVDLDEDAVRRYGAA